VAPRSPLAAAGTTIGRTVVRPYVIDAIKLGRGRFYGVGITNGKPGYYLSARCAAAARCGGGEGRHRGRRTQAKLPGDVLLIDGAGGNPVGLMT
jgi:two-component system C4-dicarboxylate transport sensor histidine kinase DctB